LRLEEKVYQHARQRPNDRNGAQGATSEEKEVALHEQEKARATAHVLRLRAKRSLAQKVFARGKESAQLERQEVRPVADVLRLPAEGSLARNVSAREKEVALHKQQKATRKHRRRKKQRPPAQTNGRWQGEAGKDCDLVEWVRDKSKEALVGSDCAY
jgi:hypothetical protein